MGQPTDKNTHATLGRFGRFTTRTDRHSIVFSSLRTTIHQCFGRFTRFKPCTNRTSIENQACALPRPRAPGAVMRCAAEEHNARQPPALSRSRTHAHPARRLAGAGPEVCPDSHRPRRWPFHPLRSGDTTHVGLLRSSRTRSAEARHATCQGAAAAACYNPEHDA